MYQVSDHTRSQFEKMLGLASVKEALAFIEANQPEAIEEQKELVLIEAPTGHEENRAKVFAEKFKALGLEDVHTDRGGNVIGIRRGTGKGPKVLIEGHMDTVFPFGTVKGVEEKDGFLYAPGIGDDTRALAMLLCLIRTLNKTGIQTAGDIVFVGTTREEGMGGLGGMKDFLADNDDIDISLSLDNNDMSLLVFEATGGETYEVNFYGIGGHAFGCFGKMAQPVHAAARAVAKIADFVVPSDPKTSFCVSNFHGGNDAGVHAIAPKATIKFNFRSNSQEELEKLRDRIFAAIDEACKEETDRWGMDTITYEVKHICDVNAGHQDSHASIVEGAMAAAEFLGCAEPKLGNGGSTNCNRALEAGLPAVCLGGGCDYDCQCHTLDEQFKVEDAFKGCQQTLLMTLLCAGTEMTESII